MSVHALIARSLMFCAVICIYFVNVPSSIARAAEKPIIGIVVTFDGAAPIKNDISRPKGKNYPFQQLEQDYRLLDATQSIAMMAYSSRQTDVEMSRGLAQNYKRYVQQSSFKVPESVYAFGRENAYDYILNITVRCNRLEHITNYLVIAFETYFMIDMTTDVALYDIKGGNIIYGKVFSASQRQDYTIDTHGNIDRVNPALEQGLALVMRNLNRQLETNLPTLPIQSPVKAQTADKM